MVTAGGFAIERWTRPYVVPFNRHPLPAVTAKTVVERAVRRAVAGAGTPGVVHRAVLARPIEID
jgi:hypothetical protein